MLRLDKDMSALTTVLTSTGNVLMLSEGRPGIDTVFSLRDGKFNVSVP